MRIETQHSGEVEVKPQDVVAIWSENVLNDGRFTHSIDMKDSRNGGCRRVYAVTADTADELSRISGLPITKMELESHEGPYAGLRPLQTERADGGRPAVCGSGPHHGQRTLAAWAPAAGGLRPRRGRGSRR